MKNTLSILFEHKFSFFIFILILSPSPVFTSFTCIEEAQTKNEHNFSKLHRKLKWYGIDENLYSWIKEFVTQREMRVNVKEVYVKWNVMDSEVP